MMDLYDFSNVDNDKMRDAFLFVSKKIHIHEALIEKDFWVVFLLKYLFSDSPWKDNLLFKGGTCLSKCYGAIDRFSEDIDLVLDWRLIGYPDDGPSVEPSRKKQDKSNEILLQKSNDYKENIMVGRIINDLSGILKKKFDLYYNEGDIYFKYPSVFDNAPVNKTVLLEIGARGMWAKSEIKPIKSFVNACLESLVEDNVVVKSISMEQAFVEKLSILHGIANKSRTPLRSSRHYYDVYMISNKIDIKKIKEQLFEEVKRFKIRFYYGAGYSYETFSKGTIRFIPSESLIKELEEDYRQMHEMIFGEPSSFEVIMKRIKELETELNS